jgi:hypothetical protein
VLPGWPCGGGRIGTKMVHQEAKMNEQKTEINNSK